MFSFFPTSSRKKIGQGIQSTVFNFSSGKVLKVGKNFHSYPSLQKAGIMPKVYKKTRTSMLVEKVKTYENANFKERKLLRSLVSDFQKERNYIKKSQSFFSLWFFPKVNKSHARPLFEKYGWGKLLSFDLTNFHWGDVRIANVGIKKGKPVLLDEGVVKYK